MNKIHTTIGKRNKTGAIGIYASRTKGKYVAQLRYEGIKHEKTFNTISEGIAWRTYLINELRKEDGI